MLRHRTIRGEDTHSIGRFDRIRALIVELGSGIVDASLVELEMLDHEGVHRLSLEELVAVLLVWEVRVLDVG